MRQKQFAVLGLGRFGQSIVKTLSQLGYNVLACDSDPEVTHEVSQYATHVVQLDVTDETAMASLGLDNFDVVVIAIGVSLEACIVATLIAKDSGARYIVAKAQNQVQKQILQKVGADRVVLPEWEMGEKIATSLIASNLIDYIHLSDEHSIAEVEPIDEWCGTSLRHSNIGTKTGLNIVAVKRGKEVFISPRADFFIQNGDVLVVIGEIEDIQRFTGKKRGGLFG